jgi:hypothetical protein
VTVRVKPTGYAHPFHRTDAVRYMSWPSFSAYRPGRKHVTETPEDFARNYTAFSHWLLTGR